MKKRLFWSLILGMALMASAAAKDGPGKGKGQGKGKGNPHNAQRSDDRRYHDRDDHRWEVRDGWEYRTFHGDDRPPGWSKGKKTGWGRCNMPPGLAKKYGCNYYRYKGRDYYWYRDDIGRIIIRRPIISIHGGIDIG